MNQLSMMKLQNNSNVQEKMVIIVITFFTAIIMKISHLTSNKFITGYAGEAGAENQNKERWELEKQGICIEYHYHGSINFELEKV